MGYFSDDNKRLEIEMDQLKTANKKLQIINREKNKIWPVKN